MMYGTVETLEERIEHLMRLRELQDETGGFTAFITWSFQPEHTELGGTEATGVDYLRTLALARIVLDNFDNLQASWVTQGGKVGQLSLAYGANDMGSVMIEENVVRAAGAAYCMDEIEIVRNVEDAGFVPKRRNMHYDMLGDPIFRERAVPRMLSLATARADGSGGEAPDAQAVSRPQPQGEQRGDRCDVGSPPIQSSRSAWLLPISQPPIRDAWLRTDRGRIVAFGHYAPRRFHRARRNRSRRRRGPAGPRQRPHPSRAVLDARPHSGDRRFRELDPHDHRAEDARPPGMATKSPRP